MPVARISDDLEMDYRVDDYTDPWTKPEAVLLLHGNAESGAMWFGWVPHLARHFRVVRPDMRGMGASSPMPRDFPWSLDQIVDDFITLTRQLGIERFHLVGAKIAGTIARRLAARFPEQVLTLTLVGTPPPQRKHAPGTVEAWTRILEQDGMQGWARATLSGRLGSTFPAAGSEWWVQLMSRTALTTQLGFVATIPTWDITADLPRITCPTLVITTEGSALGTVDETRLWQEKIPRSTLLALPGDSFHVAATDPDRCAEAACAFMMHPRD